MSIAVAGFLLGLSLIVAIGPQNALIIKQGIKREAIVPVLLVCMFSDIILIFGGTAGVGVLVDRAPLALSVLKWTGAAYLAYFGYTCFRDAFRSKQEGLTTADAPELDIPVTLEDAPTTKLEHTQQSSGGQGSQVAVREQVTTLPTTKPHTKQRTWVKPVLAAFAFTWLNPATYIDVLVMLGGMANQYGADGRWLFAAGALAASMVWFPLLGGCATRFAPVLARPQVWRVINIAIGCIMVLLCIRLMLH